MLKARRVACNSIITVIFWLLFRVFPTLRACASSMSQLNIQVQETDQFKICGRHGYQKLLSFSLYLRGGLNIHIKCLV